LATVSSSRVQFQVDLVGCTRFHVVWVSHSRSCATGTDGHVVRE
jgi:hypothetical protein